MKKNLALIFLLIGTHFAFAQKQFKTSCVSWCFHDFAAGTDPIPAINTISELGFDGIQLMINQPVDIDSLWTDSKIESVKQLLKEKHLELVSIVPFFPCLPDLGSNDPGKVAISLENFRRCCRIARKLGAKNLEIIGPHLSEFNKKQRGIPYFEYKIENFEYKPGQKLTLDIPDNVSWQAIWQRMVKVIKQCSQIAKENGLFLVIEPHVNSIIPDYNGFLLFWNELKDANVKMNFDAGWGAQQCQYAPMVVYISQKLLQIMQFRDVDNMTRNFVPMGQGVVNISATLTALKQTKFKGYVSFEEVAMPSAKEDALRFLKMMNEF